MDSLLYGFPISAWMQILSEEELWDLMGAHIGFCSEETFRKAMGKMKDLSDRGYLKTTVPFI